MKDNRQETGTETGTETESKIPGSEKLNAILSAEWTHIEAMRQGPDSAAVENYTRLGIYLWLGQCAVQLASIAEQMRGHGTDLRRTYEEGFDE